MINSLPYVSARVLLFDPSRPVIGKKGECFWYLEYIGGLNSNASTEQKPAIEQAQLAIYTTLQWDATLMSWSGGKQKLDFKTETLGTTLVEEIDHDLQ